MSPLVHVLLRARDALFETLPLLTPRGYVLELLEMRREMDSVRRQVMELSIEVDARMMGFEKQLVVKEAVWMRRLQDILVQAEHCNAQAAAFEARAAHANERLASALIEVQLLRALLEARDEASDGGS